MRLTMAAVAAVLFVLAVPSVAAAQVTVTPTRFDDPVGATCLPTSCSLRDALELTAGR